MGSGSFNGTPRLLGVGDQLSHVHVIKAATNVAKVGEQCSGWQMVESHCLAFDFGEPIMVDWFDNHPAKVVLNAEVPLNTKKLIYDN